MSRSKKNSPPKTKFEDADGRHRRMKPYAPTPGVHKEQTCGGGHQTSKKKEEAKASNRAVKKRKRQLDKKDIKKRLDEE